MKIGFALAKKVGQGGGGRVCAQGAMYMVVYLAGYKRAFVVSTDWTISHLLSTNGLRNHSSALVGAPFLNLQSVLAGWRALTIESSLLSGCGYGHKPKAIVSKKL